MVVHRFNEWLSKWDFAPEPNEINISQFMDAYELNNKLKWICELVIEEYTAEYHEAI
ncbi:hypothetical protein [Lactococcus cremoris]|nr:hypothetical protein [Lactococcus cremoris]WJQ76290.1 hypothetical protein LLNCDO700_13840 [Lactococcus cremoris]